MTFEARDWPVISALLDEALELPPEHRGRWLDELPDDSRSHRPALERLLADHARVQTLDFLNTLPRLDLDDEAQDATAGDGSRTVGPYRLLNELGRPAFAFPALNGCGRHDSSGRSRLGLSSGGVRSAR